MLLHEDVPFQLVDLPPVSADTMEPWLPNALQPAHAALLIVDLHEPGCVEHVAAIRERLDQKRIGVRDDWGGRLAPGLDPDRDAGGDPADVSPRSGGLGAGDGGAPDGPAAGGDAPIDDPLRVELPTLLVLSKADLGVDVDEVVALQELAGTRFPALVTSAESRQGLDRLGPLLMRGLAVVRVYTKVPGKPPDLRKPYTLIAGDTVEDLARQIHRDLAASLLFARVWGSAKFEGQQVGRDHPLVDGDIVELHS
jgi:ribosome-interacting GTPase 1